MHHKSNEQIKNPQVSAIQVHIYISDISGVQSIITKGTCLSTKGNSGVRKVLPDEVSK